MNRGFKRSALRYLTMWLDGERKLINCLREKPIPIDPFRKMCIDYGVHRNLNGQYDQFAKMLERRRNGKIRKEDVKKSVADLDHKMEKMCGERVLSGITKALWFMNGHPVVIYDALALRGLQSHFTTRSIPARDYEKYFDCWFECFENSEKDVKSAQEWLLNSGLAEELSQDSQIDWEEMRKFVGSLDFQNRILDKYLWRLGQELRN